MKLHRPLIFVEVFERQLREMQQWADSNCYRMQVVDTNTGAAYRNWLLFPGETG